MSKHVLFKIQKTLFPDNLKGTFVMRKKDNTLTFTVRGITSCKRIIEHFNKYKLLGEKQTNFKLFSFIVKCLEEKKHLLENSIEWNNIIQTILTMNNNGKYRRRKINILAHGAEKNGKKSLQFSDSTIRRFSDFSDTDVEEKEVEPWYITGLIDGDGTFNLTFSSSSSSMRIKPVFAIGALNESKNVLEMLRKYFKCGKIYEIGAAKKYSRYQVEALADLRKNIIPHFKKYPLETKKKDHYNIWQEIIYDMAETKTKQEKREWMYKVIEKAYEMNMNGKRRKKSKEEYIKQVEEAIKNEMKV